MLCSPRLRGAERVRRGLHEAYVVAGAFLDAVEVCEGPWWESEVGVEVLEQAVDRRAAVFYVAGEQLLVV